MMYVRFVLPWTNSDSRVSDGIFGAYFPVQDMDSIPRHLKDAIEVENNWFRENLPVPNRFDVRSRKRWLSLGICWFRDHAREHIAHGYEFARLVTEAGILVEKKVTRQPGTILYRDDFQIVAKPE